MSESSNPDSSAGTVVFLSGDLIFASRVQGAAQRAGWEFCLSGSLPSTDGRAIRYVVLDLSTRSSLVPEIVAQCAGHCPQAKLIAYGPHVQAGKLSAATEAGIPVVLTRGQFDARMSVIFSQPDSL